MSGEDVKAMEETSRSDYADSDTLNVSLTVEEIRALRSALNIAFEQNTGSVFFQMLGEIDDKLAGTLPGGA